MVASNFCDERKSALSAKKKKTQKNKQRSSKVCFVKQAFWGTTPLYAPAITMHCYDLLETKLYGFELKVETMQPLPMGPEESIK